MDLKEYYFQNIQEDKYHYRFFDDINSSEQANTSFLEYMNSKYREYVVFDAKKAISKFRQLCQPEVKFSYDNRCWFYLTSYYLHKMGFEIKEFPKVLASPPLDPDEFTYSDIRNRLISGGKDDNGTVRYVTRKVYVASLTFVQKSSHIVIDECLDKKFRKISTRQASLNEMSQDEMLKEIANLIEHFLKKDGKFMKLDYSSISFEFITDEMVTKFRRKMQCFRHATEDTIKERNAYSAEQKDFFVDYGLTIVKVIVSIKKQIE